MHIGETSRQSLEDPQLHYCQNPYEKKREPSNAPPPPRPHAPAPQGLLALSFCEPGGAELIAPPSQIQSQQSQGMKEPVAAPVTLLQRGPPSRPLQVDNHGAATPSRSAPPSMERHSPRIFHQLRAQRKTVVPQRHATVPCVHPPLRLGLHPERPSRRKMSAFCIVSKRMPSARNGSISLRISSLRLPFEKVLRTHRPARNSSHDA